MNLSYSDMESLLMRELRLYHYPVAVTFLKTEDELDRFRQSTPHVRPARPLTFCQWEIAARMDGKTVVGESRHLGCANGKVSFGWAAYDENDYRDGAVDFGSRDLAQRILNSKPSLAAGSLTAVAAGPLGKAVLPPDVIHFYCDTMQSRTLASDYMVAMAAHPLRPMVCESSAACGGAVFCHQEQTFNLTPCCQGSYTAGKTERGEINVFIPGPHLEAVIGRLQTRMRSAPGRGYPGADICTNCPMIEFERGSRKPRKKEG